MSNIDIEVTRHSNTDARPSGVSPIQANSQQINMGHETQYTDVSTKRQVNYDTGISDQIGNYGEAAKDLALQQERIGQKITELAQSNKFKHATYLEEREFRIQRERELEKMRLHLDQIREKERELARNYESEHEKFLREQDISKERESTLFQMQRDRAAAEERLAQARNQHLRVEGDLQKLSSEQQAEKGIREKLEAELRAARERESGLSNELAGIVRKQEEMVITTRKERKERKFQAAQRAKLETDLRTLEDKLRQDELLHQREMKEERKKMEMQILEIEKRSQMKDAAINETDLKLREMESILQEKERVFRQQLEDQRFEMRRRAEELERVLAAYSHKEGVLSRRQEEIKERIKLQEDSTITEVNRLRNQAMEAEHRARIAEEKLVQITRHSQSYNNHLLALGEDVKKISEKIIEISRFNAPDQILNYRERNVYINQPPVVSDANRNFPRNIGNPPLAGAQHQMDRTDQHTHLGGSEKGPQTENYSRNMGSPQLAGSGPQTGRRSPLVTSERVVETEHIKETQGQNPSLKDPQKGTHVTEHTIGPLKVVHDKQH
jgi:hypothetical protein